MMSASVWAGPDVQMKDAGEMGKRRLERLLEVPDNLARLSADERATWLENAAERVEGTAQAEGWLDASCQIRLGIPDSTENEIDVVVTYLEGPRYRFGTVQVVVPINSGIVVPDSRMWSNYEDKPFRQEEIGELLQEGVEFYHRRGWLDAEATPTRWTDSVEHRVHVKIIVEPGKAAIFDQQQIVFQGKHLTQESILRDLWPVHQGDTLLSEELSTFNRKLYKTQLYSSVRLNRLESPDDPNRTLLEVKLKERVPGTLEGGISWEPTYGWALDGLVRHRNVAGTMNELSLKGMLAERNQQIRLGGLNPLFLGTLVSLDGALLLEQRSAALVDTTSYREFTLSSQATLTWPTTNWSWVSYSLNTERVSKFSIITGNKTQYQYTTVLAAGLEKKDDPFDPILGWTLQASLGNGGRFGFDSTFTWVQSQSRFWVPLYWRFLSAAALDGGYFLNTTTLDGASIFWQGGGRSVRSYKYNALRVTPDEGQALRPRYLRGSAELRMNLPWSLQMVGFQDWARLWNEGQAPALDKLSRAAWGYGLGVRYRLSLLSLRLDYSWGRGGEMFAFDLAQAI